MAPQAAVATLPIRVSGQPFTDVAAVAALEAMIASDPANIMLRFARACALEDLGRGREAQLGYIDVLAHDAGHFGALTNLGSFAHVRGQRDIARAFYAKAVALHPHDAIGYINLGNAFVEAGDRGAAKSAYAQALRIRPGYSNAHFALSVLYGEGGERDLAQRHRQLAFAKPIVATAAYHGTGVPIDVLVLVSANGGNLVSHPYLDSRTLRVYTFVAEGYRPEVQLPAHHVLLNAIGDADRAADALRIAQRIARCTAAPVLNDPARVLATGRAAVTERMRSVADVVAPLTQSFARAAVRAGTLEAAGFRVPFLLRSPGFHTGDHFECVEDWDALDGVRDALPGEELLAIQMLDGRGDDGAYRKFRVMFVDGKLYPLHLAISPKWKVHYFSADMNVRADHRAEEARFLHDMPGTIGARAAGALERIAAALALDYGGIDFGLDRDGNVLLYESNATMAVFAPPPGPRFAYRAPAVERVYAAVRVMLAERAQRGGYVPA